MDKRSAMAMVNEHWGSRLLDGGNTSFANINASKPVWWINPVFPIWLKQVMR